jgi:hypothetical protein
VPETVDLVLKSAWREYGSKFRIVPDKGHLLAGGITDLDRKETIQWNLGVLESVISPIRKGLEYLATLLEGLPNDVASREDCVAKVRNVVQIMTDEQKKKRAELEKRSANW